MIDNFDDLMASASTGSVDNLQSQIDDLSPKRQQEQDPRFWDLKHLIDEETGNGRAKIRFLPQPQGDPTAFVRYWSYFHKGDNGQVYANKSRMSLSNDEKDPVYAYNGKLFADKSLTEDERKAMLISRRTHYVANILVVEDPVQPENNGKVFLFEFGQQIMNKITEKAKPQYDDIEKVDVFNPVKGAVFNLRIKRKFIGKKPVPNYEDSAFEEGTSQMAKDKAAMKKIWESEYSLAEFRSEEFFEPYEKLVANWNRVMGVDEEDVGPTQERRDTKSSNSKSSKTKEKDEDLSLDSSSDPDPLFSEDDDDFFSKIG